MGASQQGFSPFAYLGIPKTPGITPSIQAPQPCDFESRCTLFARDFVLRFSRRSLPRAPAREVRLKPARQLRSRWRK